MIELTAQPGLRATTAARLVPQTFECRPTREGLAASDLPDELMFDWGKLPRGTRAKICLPAVGADKILAIAERLYGGQSFIRIDNDTIELEAGGTSYVPIPPGRGGNYAGLLTVELPEGVLERSNYSIAVRQVTSFLTERDGRSGRGRNRRRVRGAFQLTVPVRAAERLREPEERRLAFFRWVLDTLDVNNRWHPVMKRFVEALALRVGGLGGDAGTIGASSLGALPGEKPEPGEGCGWGTDVHEWCGKVEELIFDGFGDFEGFRMRTEAGGLKAFYGRKGRFAVLVERAWQARLRVTVVTSKHHLDAPLHIVLRAAGNGGW